jgi:hypothetical protein
MQRRQFLTTGLLATAFAKSADDLLAQPAPDRQLSSSEVEIGDPGGPSEVLRFNSSFVEQFLHPRAAPIRKEPKKVALRMLEIASAYVGMDRGNAPNQIAEFLQLFGLNLKYANGQFTPYCAAGLSYCACKAYCETEPPQPVDPEDPIPDLRNVFAALNEYFFRPSPACRVIMNDAQHRGTWVTKADAERANAQSGWLALFDWIGDGQPHHIGIIEASLSHDFSTVEFNTSHLDVGSGSTANQNGGAIAKKHRSLEYVLGFVRTY